MKKNSIKCGNIGVYEPESTDYSKKDWIEALDRNYKRLMALDKTARKMKSVVGRVYSEQVADGHAYYLIIAESARTVTLKHVQGIGDDYRISFLGAGDTVSKGKVLGMMKMQDDFNALFSR